MPTQLLARPDGQIAYDDIGHGPLIICAPSIGDLRAEYRFLTPQLVAAGYRVVTMDLRGAGESSARWPDYSVAGTGSDMVALIRALDAGPAVIVGTSMAAGAGIWAAVEAPELVTGLVLIGPAVHGEAAGLNRLLYSALFTAPWGVAAWLWYYSTLYPTQKPADFAEYRAALQANLKEPGRLGAMQSMILASKAAAEERLSHVKTPALVLMGTRDPDFKNPAAEAEWVADRVRGRCEMVQGGGHYPHAELPDVTGAQIVSFLQTLPEACARSYAA